jgi:RHS repeat-associated protein
MAYSSGKIRAQGLTAVAAVAGLLAAVGGTPAYAAFSSHAGHHRGHRPPLPGFRAPSEIGRLSFRPSRRIRPIPPYRPLHDKWPSPSSAVLSLAPTVLPPFEAPVPAVLSALEGTGLASTARGRGTPVFAESAGPASGLGKVGVSVMSQAAAARAGVRGVIFTAQAAAGAAGGRLQLGISYSAFSQASGGDYGASLGLAELPACSLTTPRVPACQKETRLASLNDWPARTVSAVLSLPPGLPGRAGRSVILAAVPMLPDGGGNSGNFAATSLRPSGTWTAGGSSGSFTYSYPMAVPPAAGGLAPTLSLGYDSGSIDGQTAQAQQQPSWVGDGWALNGGSSYVEQSFITCKNAPGNPAPNSQDQCYAGPVLTLSLNGTSVPLVCPTSGSNAFSYSSDSTCAASADNGEVVTHHVKSANGQGTQFTDYWTVTTRDGTTYTFGINHLKGWTSGDATTNSTDWEPVYSGSSGDPCFHLTGSDFAHSVCTMAYRWNLDYVTDVHGDAMAYYYKQDTNAYAENGVTSSAVKYVRDSHLGHIDYGFTDGNAYNTTTAHPADEVTFGTGDRCTASNCDPISTYYANWPDVPYHADNCAPGQSCQVTAPTYWSTVALTSVAAQQWNGSGWAEADSWALAQTLPKYSDGSTANLWLNTITRTGDDTSTGTTGGTAPLPSVTFNPVEKANRVNPGTYPLLLRDRIGQVVTETGSAINVNYTLPVPCSATNLPSPSSNTKSCFPVYWGTFAPPNPDWYDKYAVQDVTVTDPAGGSPGLTTSYSYSSPAWHYDDNEVVQAKYRTYGQWRGYQDVITNGGATGAPQTEAETTYYQGMSNDNNNGVTVNLKDSQKNDHEDINQLAGDVLESTVYGYNSGPVDHSSIDSYYVSSAQLSRSRSGLSDLTATFTGQVEDWARQALTDGGTTTWRETETDTSYATSGSIIGEPEYVYRHGDLSDTTQQACTTVTYAPANASKNLVGLPAEIEVDARPCGGANPGGSSAPSGPSEVNALTAPTSLSRPADVVSDTRTFYDNATLATTWPQAANPTWPQAAPTTGEASVVQRATGWNGSAFTYQTQSATVYDSYGRVKKAYDGNGGFNGTSYTPTITTYTMTAGSTTKVAVANPLSQTATTTLDPLRGIPISVSDPNGILTTLQYDGLGRLLNAWEYGRATTTTPNLSYAYSVSNSGPSVVTAKKLTDTGGQITTTTLYDSLLRVRQVQAQAPLPTGGSLVTDTFYDSHGWVIKSNIGWWNSASPGSAIVTIPDSQVPDQKVTSFDGLGRPVSILSYNDSSPVSTADTAYYGDRVTSVLLNDQPATPVVDGTPTSTVGDALGRQTELDQYTTAPSVSTGTDAAGFATVSITGGSTQATTDAYSHQGRLSAITDVSTGEQWTRGYNLLGQVTSTTDPNSGKTSMSYDADGNLTGTTDALNHTITFTYDPLSRKTAEYDGSSTSAPLIATWAYDTSGIADSIGHLVSETSYDGSGNQYVIQQTGFNSFGESTGEKVTIPSTPATATANGSLAGTYTLSHTYTTETGLPSVDIYPKSPGGLLPAEAVSYGYCAGMDLPCTLGSNLNAYVQNVAYTRFFQVAQQEIGSVSNNAYVTNTYDPHTGALTDSQVANAKVSATPFDDTSYSYDPAGNVTSQKDVRNGTATELQCYSYDLLERLTQAWTTDGTSPCSSAPTTGTGGTVGDGIVAGAYWTSWQYSPLGDQTQVTQHSLTGGSDTVAKYVYNNGNGTGTGQPDTLTSAQSPPGTTTASYTYDSAGNTTARNLPGGKQALAWYDDGNLKSVTYADSSATSFIYDADGNLLLQQDPGQTTLYVFGEQLVLNLTATSNAVTGTRFFALPGGGTVARTGTAAGSSYWFETTDQHGTSMLTLDSTAANPVWRQYTPFGAPRGTSPTSWPDTNAFLGKPTGASSGLDIIGARQYDPSLGRFISIDPIFEANSPQQFNGYNYAADNPVTNSDPTGMACDANHDSANCWTNNGPCVTDPSLCGVGNPQDLQNSCPSTELGCPGYQYPAYYSGGGIFIQAPSVAAMKAAIGRAISENGMQLLPIGKNGKPNYGAGGCLWGWDECVPINWKDPWAKQQIAQGVCNDHRSWCTFPPVNAFQQMMSLLGMVLSGGMDEGGPMPDPAEPVLGGSATTWETGSELDRPVTVSGKEFGIMGRITRSESSATVSDMIMYGSEGDLIGQIGPSGLMRTGAKLLQEASASGVDSITFSGVRVATSSGLTGHEVTMTAYFDSEGVIQWRPGP